MTRRPYAPGTGKYLVQGMFSDGRITGEGIVLDEHASEARAVAAAKKLLKHPEFEGSQVRVMTRDGELIFSQSEGRRAERHGGKRAPKAPKVSPGVVVFSVRVPLGDGAASITAYEAREPSFSRTHTRLNLGLTFKGKAIFPAGSMWIGIPPHQSIDSKAAKRGAVSTFALKPGDTDAEFFDDYTPAQLDFVESYAEEISMFVIERYGES